MGIGNPFRSRSWSRYYLPSEQYSMDDFRMFGNVDLSSAPTAVPTPDRTNLSASVSHTGAFLSQREPQALVR